MSFGTPIRLRAGEAREAFLARTREALLGLAPQESAIMMTTTMSPAAQAQTLLLFDGIGGALLVASLRRLSAQAEASAWPRRIR